MTRWLVLGLLGFWVANPSAHAQHTAPVAGPVLTQPGVRRLPPLEEPLEPLPAGDASGPSQQVVGEPPKGAAIEPEAEPRLWTGSFELGLDGSEGNSQTFNSRFGFDAKRETDASRLSLDLDYRKQTDKGAETANRASLDGRYELLFPESPWSSFLDGTVDYDEFNSFDVRLTSHAGMGYQLAKAEFSKLAARVGCGVSHEIGSPDESYVPEAIFGLDFEHRLGERHKLTAMAEYMPDLTGMNDFRLRSRASWEMLIDPQMNLSLKLSALDRFDSTPNGAERNDLDYSAVLLWKF